jgi:hypothetical protein
MILLRWIGIKFLQPFDWTEETRGSWVVESAHTFSALLRDWRDESVGFGFMWDVRQGTVSDTYPYLPVMLNLQPSLATAHTHPLSRRRHSSHHPPPRAVAREVGRGWCVVHGGRVVVVGSGWWAACRRGAVAVAPRGCGCCGSPSCKPLFTSVGVVS